jgi:FtsP/CotA-like multicopper oxidase with cupredoxin domain
MLKLTLNRMFGDCHRQSLCLLTVVALITSSTMNPTAIAKDPAAGFKVFVIDDNDNETELETGVTFTVDGSGGRGTRVTVEFSDSVKQFMKGRKVRLKRGGVSVAESVITGPVAAPQDTQANAEPMTQSDKQALMAELQSIQQQEWKDLQALHVEEIADFQELDKGFQDQLAAGNLSQEEINTVLARQQQNLETLRGAINRHEVDRTRLKTKHDSERDAAIATLFENGDELSEEQLSAGLTGTTSTGTTPGGTTPGGTTPGGTTPGGTTPGGTTNDSQIPRSISRQARGKFSDFNSLPVVPLAAGVPASNVAPINRQQEDALQEIVRAVFVIGHFDHVAQHTDNLFAGSPGGAAQSAGGRQVKDFPAPEEYDAEGNAYHPAISDGGTNIRFQKWVRELPRVPVAYPIDVSPGKLNTEELRRGYNPARWSAMGVGQTYHGVAPEYWQHASDWEQHPTLFFERHQCPGQADVTGTGIQTPIWGYCDGGPNADPLGLGPGVATVPGICFIGRFGEPFIVRDINLLAHSRGTHLHGAHSPAHSDGSPHFFVNPNKARDYYYPNIPPRAHDSNLLILNEAANSGVTYAEAAANLNIPLYVSRPGPAPEGDDPPGGWPAEFDGTPARVNRQLGPLGGVTGDAWEMADMTDTNWYHDHAMDETGPGAYSGLAGYYMTTDPTSEELMRRNVIPTFYPRTGAVAEDGSSAGLDFDPMKRGNADSDYGTYFQILSSADKILNADGTLFYDVLSHDGQMGDVMLANGIANPVMHVENRKYRFHCHGAGTARAWYMKLRDENYSTVSQFMQIGYDAWFYEKPIMMDGLLLFAAKRRDVVIDFGELYARGIREVYYENCLPQIDGRGPRGSADQRNADDFALPDGEPGERLVKFIITDQAIHGGKPDLNIDLNTPLRENVLITPDEIVKTRILNFKRHNGAWTINNTFYDRAVANFTPTIGTAERWIIRNNGGGWWHPIHIHLEAHQWQKINGQTPHPSEHLHKQDTTVLGSNDEIEMFMKFRTWVGPFVFHCHNLEHEDMRMMYNFDPVLIQTESPQQTQSLFP